MPIEHRQGRRGDDHGSAARNRRIARASGLNACLGGQGTRERSRAVAAWRLLRCALGLAAITALAACGEGDPLNFSGSGAATETVKPTVNMQLTPSTVAMGQSATLTWSASEAQSCTASGGWSGVQPTTGRWSTAPLSANTSYTLTCSGVGGTGARSIQVTVTHPAPVVTLLASPATIPSLGSSTLTWTTTNANECTASGGWHGQLATSGTWSTGSLSNTTEYELTCRGPWGSATQSATVTVSAESPDCDSPSESQLAAIGRLFHPELVQSKCDLMHRLRRVVRHQRRERLTIDGSGKRELDLYADVHGFRPQRDSVGDGVRDVVGTHGQHQCRAEHDRLGRQLDADVVLHQCDRLYRLRRLVGQQGDQRDPVNRRAHEQCDLHIDLSRPRGQCGAVHDGFRQGAAPHRQPERRSECHYQRRQRHSHVVVHPCDRLHRLRCLVGQQSPERLTIHRRAHGQRRPIPCPAPDPAAARRRPRRSPSGHPHPPSA